MRTLNNEKRIRKIRSKIFLNFLMLLIITTSGLLSLYSMTIKLLSDLTVESVEAMLDQIHTETNNVMSHVVKTGYMLANDASIQLPLRSQKPSTQQEIHKQRIDYNNKLFYTNQYQEAIAGIYVIGINGIVFRSSMMSLLKEDYRQEKWFQDVINGRTTIWLTNPDGSIVANSLKEPYISIVIPINDRSSIRQLGVIVMEMRGEIFNTIYRTGLMMEGDVIMLDSDKNMFLYSQVTTLTNHRLSEMDQAIRNLDLNQDVSTQYLKIDGDSYLISSMTIPLNKWQIVGIIPYREIISRTSLLEQSIVIVLFLFLISMLIFMFRTSYMISRPIQIMSSTMKTIESGNFTSRVEYQSDDEFGALANSFNHMLNRIDKLKEKEIDNQHKLRVAELKALQAQINPHFLYNTLDSIGWMARLNQIDKVEEMVDSLSTYFRISISRGSDFITLKDELTHVEKYLSIQKIRYEKKLNYSIDVPPEILHFKTIKMILQPLVENSIYHGIKEKEGSGEIRITAVLNDYIILCVEDTGIGMTKEKLDKLHEMIDSGRDYNPDAYGVINVHKRLQVFFGEDCGLRFESEYGIGTKAFITIRRISSS